MTLRPFALLADAVLAKAGERLVAAVREWQADWGLSELEAQVECWRAWDAVSAAPAMSWQCAYGTPAQSVWFGWQPELLKSLQRRMFPPEARPASAEIGGARIAAAAAAAALQALTDCVAASVAALRADGRGSAAPDAQVFAYGSGALLTTIKLGEQSMQCLFSHAGVRFLTGAAPRDGAAAPARPPLAPLGAALRNVGVRLTIEAGYAEVEVGAFLTLGVGDVIRLTAPVDEALAVLGPGGQVLFGGHLGRMEQSVAIEVARRT